MQSFSVQLTPVQATFIQSLLPKNYSMQIVTLDFKRNRPAKKLDESFTSDYGLNIKKNHQKIPHHSSNQKLELDEVEEFNAEESRNVEDIAADKASSNKKTKQMSKFQHLKLSKFLEKLKNCRYSWPFRVPVDPIAQGVPQYTEIVKQPMDLSTIERKLKDEIYTDDEQFHADVKRIILNSYDFNSEETKFYAITQKFQAFYQKICEEAEDDDENYVNPSLKRFHKEDLYRSHQKIPTKNKEDKKITSNNPQEKNKSDEICYPELPTKTALTMAQKLSEKQRDKLFHQLYMLPQSDIVNLIEIVDNGTLPKDWKEFEIDMKDIDDETFKKILKLVNEKFGKTHI